MIDVPPGIAFTQCYNFILSENIKNFHFHTENNFSKAPSAKHGSLALDMKSPIVQKMDFHTKKSKLHMAMVGLFELHPPNLMRIRFSRSCNKTKD